MKRILLFLLTLCVSSVSSVFALEEIKVGNTTRTIIVYAPQDLPKQRPLIIACHGYNQDAPYLQGQAKFESLADTAKFVVVYANGINKAWDIGGDSDLKFMETIIDSMYSRYHINKNRVYLTGFSMGGMFTYHAANRLSDKIAAFAPVSGYPMGGPNPQAGRPVPILHTHGTGDDVCTYGSVQSHINAWVQFNGCNTTPEVTTPLSATNPSSGSTLKRYRGGKNGVEVALLTLPGKGHWWSMDPPFGLTSVEVWNFCKRYALGAEEPEVRSIVPENRSFDLVPEINNTFTVTFSDSIDCSRVKATLSPEKGASIVLDVQSSGFEPVITFALPTNAVVADGTYTLTLTNAVSKNEGVMPATSYTYVYGVEEVGDCLNVDTLFCPDWYAGQATVGEGIPAGWRRLTTKSDGTKEVKKGELPNCTEVRMKYFTRGGDFDAGFYLSSRDNKSCSLAYGYYSDYLLQLNPGKYTISFKSVYWSEGALQAKAAFDFKLLRGNNMPVFSALSLTSTGTMYEKTDRRITGSTTHEFNFNIASSGSYVISFDMSSGWNSVIFGDILLTTQPSLADLYKGTFLRTMQKARRAAAAYEGTPSADALNMVLNQYSDFVSNAPSRYTAATREVEEALAAFEATAIQSVHTASRAEGVIYSLAGVAMGRDVNALPKGIYVLNGKKFIR